MAPSVRDSAIPAPTGADLPHNPLSQQGSAFPLADRRALRIEELLLPVPPRSRSRGLRREQPSLISASSVIWTPILLGSPYPVWSPAVPAADHRRGDGSSLEQEWSEMTAGDQRLDVLFDGAGDQCAGH